MAKILGAVEVDVVLDLEPPRHWDHRDVAKLKSRLMSEAGEIRDLIKHHVRHHANIDFSTHTAVREHFNCSGCGRPWTEDSAEYNGGCCDKDEEGNPDNAPVTGPAEAIEEIRADIRKIAGSP